MEGRLCESGAGSDGARAWARERGLRWRLFFIERGIAGDFDSRRERSDSSSARACMSARLRLELSQMSRVESSAMNLKGAGLFSLRGRVSLSKTADLGLEKYSGHLRWAASQLTGSLRAAVTRAMSSFNLRVDSPSGSEKTEVMVGLTVPWEPVEEGGELKGFSRFACISRRMRER